MTIRIRANVACTLLCALVAHAIARAGASRLAAHLSSSGRPFTQAGAPPGSVARSRNASPPPLLLLEEPGARGTGAAGPAEAASGEEEEPGAVRAAEERPADNESDKQGVIHHVRRVIDDDLEALSNVTDIGKDLSKELNDDIQNFRNTFIPGYKAIHVGDFVANGAVVFVGMGIILVYVHYFYRPDHGDVVRDLDYFSQPPPLAQAYANYPPELEPDIIIVFHHPAYTYDDDEKPMRSATMKEAVVDLREQREHGSPHREGCQRRGRWESNMRQFHMSRCKQLQVQIKHEEEDARLTTRLANFGSAISHRNVGALSMSLGLGSSRSSTDPAVPVTWKQARLALLQDVISGATAMGWSPTTFSSVDSDEMYVALSLREFSSTELLLNTHQYRLQVQSSVVRALGIDQPLEPESTPPLMNYDSRITAMLKDSGIPGLESGDRRKFFRCYYDHLARGHEGDICNSRDRVRLLFDALQRDVALDEAQRAGLIVTWYPVHSARWIEMLRETWDGQWLDFSFTQPITMLQAYYGSRVAFSLAWIGHWSKLLVPLTIASVIMTFPFTASRLFLDGNDVDHFRQRLSPAFAFLVALWARVAMNLWYRQEQFLLTLFDHAMDDMDWTVRPSFRGTLQPSKVDSNKMEKVSDPGFDLWRRVISGFISVVFCVMVLICVVGWIKFFNGRLGILASTILSIQIVVFNLVFEVVCERLTEWENHKFQAGFFNSYLWKHAILNFVSTYSGPIYAAIDHKVDFQDCPPAGCLKKLWTNIIMTLTMLTVVSIVKGFAVYYQVRFQLWREDRKASERKKSYTSEERTWAEEQSKYPTFRLREQVANDVELMVALGFPIMFSSIAFSVVPFCMIVFATRLRVITRALTSLTQRPVPRQHFNLSAVHGMVIGLTHFGVMFNATTMVLYNPVFEGTGPLAKTSNIFIYFLFLELTFLLVDLFVPSEGEETDILKGRREHAVKEILWHVAHMSGKDEQKSRDLCESGPSPRGEYEWSKVPTLGERLAAAREAAAREAAAAGSGVGAKGDASPSPHVVSTPHVSVRVQKEEPEQRSAPPSAPTQARRPWLLRNGCCQGG